MENTPRTPQNLHEVENSREHLPTYDMTVASYEITSVQSNIPEGKFAVHEDLIAYKSSEYSVKVMPNIEASQQQLSAMGFENAGSDYAVPGTGAEQGSRDHGEFKNIDTMMAYNLAGMDAGLKDIDYSRLTDQQRSDLESIGFQGAAVHNRSLLTEGEASYRISSGMDAEDLERRLEKVGTFTETTVRVNQNGEKVPAIAYTDQAGNQVVAPKTESLSNLMEDLGYRWVPAPDFDTDIYGQVEKANSEFAPDAAVKTNLLNQFVGGRLVQTVFNSNRPQYN